MIRDGFSYIAVLLFLAAVMVTLEQRSGWKLFRYVPAVVLLYLSAMLLCSVNFWDLTATATTYHSLKSSLTYAMIFTMLLRCNIRKLLKLSPKLLLGFFSASLSMMAGFILTYSFMNRWLQAEAWRTLGALCGSWLGGAGNMIAIQAALQVSETDMGYALLIDTVNYSIWIVFLLWSIPLAPKFNRWTQANTQDIDMLAKQTIPESEKKPITFQSLTLLLGLSFLISVISQGVGKWLGANFSILDAGTWTVLFITVLGLLAALTPLEQVPGANEVSNILLYLIVALLASRASLAQIGSAAIWILTGFIIMTIHGILLVFLCKLFKLDLFTGAVGSLANIGGTASAPILAGAYSSALVPLGILMALIGYVVGTPLGLFTAKIMELLA